MRSSLPAFLAFVKRHEGGYVNHSQDPGGCTNMGITLATYRNLVDPRATCADLAHMPWEAAEAIYRERYWGAVRGDELPAGVDLCVADFAVNSGRACAIRLLQEVLRVAVDGVIGPRTLAAAAAADPAALCADYCAARLRYYRQLRHWRTFGRGWSRRVAAARQAAGLLIATPAALGLASLAPAPRGKQPWRSRTLAGVAVAVLAWGVQIVWPEAELDRHAFTEFVLQAVELGGLLLAALGRWRARQPIRLRPGTGDAPAGDTAAGRLRPVPDDPERAAGGYWSGLRGPFGEDA